MTFIAIFATESADKQDIKRSISLYKQQMMEELEALDDGKEPLEAAMEQYDKAVTFSEKNKLRMRIEKMVLRQNGIDGSRPRTRAEDVEKALAYMRGEETESRNVTERYLELATAEDIRGDARIRAARAAIRAKADEYRRLLADGKTAEAARFRQQNREYFVAEGVLNSQMRLTATNKNLLGKGHDKPIMKLIGNSRNTMLRAIDGIE